MPRCNLKRIIILISFFGVVILLITSIMSSSGRHKLTHHFVIGPAEILSQPKKNKTIITKFKKDFFIQISTAQKSESPPENRFKRKSNNLTTSFLNSTFQCGLDGVLTVKSGGRLGNQMGEYGTLFALALRDSGIFPFLQHRTYVTLSKYFVNISIPTISNLNCSLKWNSMNLHVYNKMNKSQRMNLAREGGIFIDGYPTSVSLFHRHRREITREFQFKSHIILKAQEQLHRLRRNRPQDVVFVGVHIRRTGLFVKLLLTRFHTLRSLIFFNFCS